MAWVASCHNGNGGVFHPDAENCLWTTRKKYHKKENAQKRADAHSRACSLASYNKGTSVMDIRGGLRNMKWGD